MRNLTLPNKIITIYRICFAGLSWFTLIAGAIIYSFTYGSILGWFNSFIAFTMQTNLIVTLWFTFAIFWFNKPELLEKFLRPVKGAFTLYITITFLFFAILLSPFYHPTGWAAFSNLVLHYITPIAFILDWVLTETKLRYKWNYILYWMIYPLCYLVFVFIYGTFTGNYIYYFLDINALGISGYFIFISILIAVGLALGCLYIAINRWKTS
ncbi:MAG: Pr6Pr family membrane protein [Promethearchaeota archaeon]